MTHAEMTSANFLPADEEDVIYALNAKDTARSLGLQKGAAKVPTLSPVYPELPVYACRS
jgi:hypothetical protein